MVLVNYESHLAWWTAAWGLPVAAQTSARMSLPWWEGRIWIHSSKIPLFHCMFVFVHRSATRFISPLSHYGISGPPKHLAHWRCAVVLQKRLWALSQNQKTPRGEGHCQRTYRKCMPVLENQSSKYKSSIRRLRNQGVGTGSRRWIIGRLPWGSKNKTPRTTQSEPERQKKSSLKSNKLIALASQVFYL